MEKLPHYNFSWTVSLQKQRNTSLKELSLEEAMDLSQDRLILELAEYDVDMSSTMTL
jgi:hypothetical protein